MSEPIDAEIRDAIEAAYDLALEARYIQPWPYDAKPQEVFEKLERARKRLDEPPREGE